MQNEEFDVRNIYTIFSKIRKSYLPCDSFVRRYTSPLSYHISMSFFRIVVGSDSESDSEGDHSDGYDGAPDCSCGRCPGGGFGLFMSQFFFGSYAYDPWANRREKSSASESREKMTMRKFNDVKDKVDHALLEKTKVGSISNLFVVLFFNYLP